MTRLTEEKSTRQARSTERTPAERQTRVPLGTLRSKLTAESREGYHRHWINDVAGRLSQALAGGYNFVHSKGEKVGEGQELSSYNLGTMTSRIVGNHENGAPMSAYLMEIKQEWRDEDMAEKAKADALIDEQIKGGALDDGGEFGNEHRYIPDGGIKYNP